MRNHTISFQDLMRECNVDNAVEFRRLIRRNGLPSVSERNDIDRKEAEKIVRRLTGRGIDWYKYKVQSRDAGTQGPLRRKALPETESLVENWFSRIEPGSVSGVAGRDRILGIVCSGGFLQQTQDTEFAVKLDPSVNILIGDRGSGKSTLINLVGLLADSVSQETDVLATKLLNLFTETAGGSASFNRRVRKFLRHYSIRKYACYFMHDMHTYCYYVDLTDGMFDVLVRSAHAWESADVHPAKVVPSTLLLQQGEVIRIAEGRSHYYLNNILDALFPDLHKNRELLAQETKSFSDQYERYVRTYASIKNQELSEFLSERSLELQSIWSDVDRGYLSDESIRLIRWYVDRYFLIERSTLPRSIPDLLAGNEDAYYYLYLGRIIGFLSRSIREIEMIRERQIDTFAYSGSVIGSVDRSTQTDLELGSEAVAELIAADKQALGTIEVDVPSEQESTTSSEESLLKTEHELFVSSLRDEGVNYYDRELVEKGEAVADFLQTRLRVLRKWVEIYGRRRIAWTEASTSLAQRFTRLLRLRADLISQQQTRCSEISSLLNQDNIELRVFTQGADQAIADHGREVSELVGIAQNYALLMQAEPDMKLVELDTLASAYDDAVSLFFDKLKRLGRQVIRPQNEFLFQPIAVELRQGNTYRSFQQLSFGQKSGIILKMVLAATEKRVIVIDQPEDNLDASSIVNMLAPTLARLAPDRQIVIATHDSNLVMGMNTHNLIVLESLGDNGRIRIQGPVVHRDVIREMLDVLEGGIPTFDMKMRIYEDFVSRVSGLIEDVELVLIERSFRKRTIDSLRNFLQPVISDRTLVEYLRHELRQRDPARIRRDLSIVRQQLADVTRDPGLALNDLSIQLDRLLERLDSHILRLQDAIEELRLMDTQPKPRLVEVYALLDETRTDFLARLGKARQVVIDIDPAFQKEVVFADRDHLRLIFANLISNSLRATERRIVNEWRLGNRSEMVEAVDIRLVAASDLFLDMLYRDNGCGIPPGVRDKLYQERCSDQSGKDHGLGGVIIRKLLDLNGGGIKILSTSSSGAALGTVQQIRFRRQEG